VKLMGRMRLAELLARQCGKQLGEPGWAPRTVLAHIQRWWAEH
jgi:hypothetical protein